MWIGHIWPILNLLNTDDIKKKALIPIQWNSDLDDANKDFKVEHIFFAF